MFYFWVDEVGVGPLEEWVFGGISFWWLVLGTRANGLVDGSAQYVALFYEYW